MSHRVLHRRPGISARGVLRRRNCQPRHQNPTPLGQPVRERQNLRQVPLPAGLLRCCAYKKRPPVLQKPFPVFDSELDSHPPHTPSSPKAPPTHHPRSVRTAKEVLSSPSPFPTQRFAFGEAQRAEKRRSRCGREPACCSGHTLMLFVSLACCTTAAQECGICFWEALEGWTMQMCILFFFFTNLFTSVI